MGGDRDGLDAALLQVNRGSDDVLFVQLLQFVAHGIDATADNSIGVVLTAAACVALMIAALALRGITNRLTHHSVWSHEHFSGATLAQFLYVAAQCGIFAFFINYVVSETPSLPASLMKEKGS